MPLSEEELRLLEQMERALAAEDPKLASTMRGSKFRHRQRRRAYAAAAVFVLGVVVLMAGAIASQTIVGIVGFVLMLGAAYVALTSWRGQSASHETEAKADPQAPFTLIDGGRSGKRGSKPARGRTSHGSMMERMEERWRRRREQNGF